MESFNTRKCVLKSPWKVFEFFCSKKGGNPVFPASSTGFPKALGIEEHARAGDKREAREGEEGEGGGGDGDEHRARVPKKWSRATGDEEETFLKESLDESKILLIRLQRVALKKEGRAPAV